MRYENSSFHVLLSSTNGLGTNEDEDFDHLIKN